MARNKETIQDKLISQMARNARINDRSSLPVTLEEQIAESERLKNLGEAGRFREMGYGAWTEMIVDHMRKTYHQDRWSIERRMSSNRRKMQEFHEKGSSLKEVCDWIDEQVVDF
jgi:hypothetical protein